MLKASSPAVTDLDGIAAVVRATLPGQAGHIAAIIESLKEAIAKARGAGMKLVLLHRRRTTAEDMKDWRYDGPTIEGVKYFHSTYQSTFTIRFISKGFADQAAAIAGWNPWDESVLEMEFEDECLKCGNSLYGDWDLQA